MKFYATCQYKCGADNNIHPTNSNYTCRLGHDIMATGSGDHPADNTTNSPSSLYSSSCPQLTQYRSLPRNLYSAIRRPLTQQQQNFHPQRQLQHQHHHHQQQQQQQHQLYGSCEQTLRTNSEQELRRSAFDKSHRQLTKNLILCNKCAV